MKNFDSFDAQGARRHFAGELTSVLPLWNHPKTVAPALTFGASFRGAALLRSAFWQTPLRKVASEGPPFESNDLRN